MRVLVLSAYDAASHRQWHDCLRRGIGEWQWQVLALPPRHFNWRIRGNPLHWALAERGILEQEYDLLLATSMVDLATLRGLVPGLARLPAALYFHENQFAYPESRGRHGQLEARMVSLYSALAAQCLLFNSSYNLESFMRGCELMLKSFPDAVPPGIVPSLREKARVLPVPLELTDRARTGPSSPVLQLLWNHRWEYDKGPQGLLEISRSLLHAGLDFELHVVGQQFREQPPAFAELRELLAGAGSLGRWGYLAQQYDYLELLRRCDVVLSTALHDFQGLALMHACDAGCSPLAPARLVYPEWLSEEFLYTSDEADRQREADAAAAKILALAEKKSRGEPLPLADVSRFRADVLLDDYRHVLTALE